jgi:hypothetical protein
MNDIDCKWIEEAQTPERRNQHSWLMESIKDRLGIHLELSSTVRKQAAQERYKNRNNVEGCIVLRGTRKNNKVPP